MLLRDLVTCRRYSQTNQQVLNIKLYLESNDWPGYDNYRHNSSKELEPMPCSQSSYSTLAIIRIRPFSIRGLKQSILTTTV